MSQDDWDDLEEKYMEYYTVGQKFRVTPEAINRVFAEYDTDVIKIKSTERVTDDNNQHSLQVAAIDSNGEEVSELKIDSLTLAEDLENNRAAPL